MPYMDPVARAEQEIEELLRLQHEEIHGTKPGDTPDPGRKAEDEGTPPQPEPAKPQPAEDDPNSDTWKQRFITLQGKYNAEVPAFAAEIRDLKARLQAMQEATQPPQTPDAQKPANVDEALAELESEYGGAFIQALDRIISARVNQTVEPYAQKVRTVEEQAAKSAQGRFHDELSAAVKGDWKAMNYDPQFVAWLQSNHAGSHTYQELLQDAYRKGDLAGTAQFFNLYLDGTTPPGAELQKQTQPKTPSPDDMVVPPKKGGGSHTTIENAQGKVWTIAEVNEFYKQYELGKIDAATAAKTEREIMKANAEGRIIG